MKQEKKMFWGVVVLSGINLFTSPVSAAEVDSKGYVNFEQKDDHLIGGPLRIDGISTIHFGTQPLKGDTVVYKSIYTDSEKNKDGKFVPLHVETTDNRGTNAGWQLQSKQSRQFTEIDNAGLVVSGGSVLTGSELNLTALESYDNGAIEESEKLKPSGLIKSSTLNTTFKTVVNSKENEGVGSWSTHFGPLSDTATTAGMDGEGQPVQVPVENGSVTLTVPGKIAKKKSVRYEAELTWTLVATPEA